MAWELVFLNIFIQATADGNNVVHVARRSGNLIFLPTKLGGRIILVFWFQNYPQTGSY